MERLLSDFGDFIAKLLSKQPKSKTILYLVYYPLIAISMVAAWLLISYVLPHLIAMAGGLLFPLWLLAMLVLGVLSLVGFLVKKWLLS